MSTENKPKKKLFIPPVPKFEEISPITKLDDIPKKIENIEAQQETLNKFLMEIKGEAPLLDQKAPTKIISTVIPQALPQTPILPLPVPMQKPDFKQSLDLITNLYNRQMKSDSSPKENIKKIENTPKISVPPVLIKINEEYDPARPNDYEVLLAERNRKKKEKENLNEGKKSAKMEIEPSPDQKNINTTQNNQQKIEKITPKKITMEIEKEKEQTTEEKILKMMEKSGWKLGQGLGKNEQGMTTPLIPKKTNSNTAIIVNSKDDMSSLLPQDVVLKKTLESQNITATRLIYLANMVTMETIDDNLREEVIEECGKFGTINNCVIFAIKNVAEEESVRIFLEFEKKENAIKAYFAMDGRFFAERKVIARFYDENLFMQGIYDN